MPEFDAAHAAVHYPADRRFHLWVRPSILIGIAVAVAVAVLAAWIEVALAGLPPVQPVPQIYPNNFAGPHGFPLWVRYCHFFNFLFVMLLIRSGLSILYDHPRLYFNDDCTPGSEWVRFTPLAVPHDRLWTAKDDARYISPLVGTPGYRHTIGIARVWHFINVHGFILTGLIFAIGLFDTQQWRRIVPTTPLVVVQAWNTFVHYATLHLPPEPNGFYGYNALQQIAYFTVFFVFGPLAIATGIAMSPVTLVVMNHIVMGTDDLQPQGMIWGFVGIGVVVLSWAAAHYLSWNHPRGVQHALKSVTYPMQQLTLNRLVPAQYYSEADISPFFWPNGKVPVREDWKRLAETGFHEFKLKVGGLVENPVELTLRDLEQLGFVEHVTMHHCIQGWSGIAKWGGVPMHKLIQLVRPKPEARTVAFFSFGEALYGGAYYDTQSLDNVLKAECLLASQMNDQPLTGIYGAPLRLRVENQLGYKMVKWIERIEFVTSEKLLGAGEGGKNEDDEYFDLLPNI
jgi:methionine sulfoxide reductase catalytic subunit